MLAHLTVADLMARWQCSRTKVWEVRRDPRFPEPLKILGRPRWRVVDIERFENE
ncbi:hypothetical protein [uncultured Rothia sp.]|uniref:helix-turn-helix transcriptional regulator n=1 Tax=uncultured Rothia sp. TaxID=316088 RepID=UPI0032167147